MKTSGQRLFFSEQDIRELIAPCKNKPYVFLESALIDKENHSSLLFTDFSDILTFHHHDDPHLFFNKVQDYLAKGYWACGYFDYEFGYFLDPALKELRDKSEAPLAWVGMSRPPHIIRHKDLKNNLEKENTNLSYSVKNIHPNISEREYAGCIQKIKEHLEEGFSYQVNYTFKMKFDFEGDILDFYLNLRRAQPTPYLALINTGNQKILSFSPELFFRINGKQIITRPMKGTAWRGLTPQEDLTKRDGFAKSEKIRAENVMIVDLLRNDLGRVSQRVWVPKLFEIEKYHTLFQMTSTIQAELKNDLSLFDIFSSLFPSGSVTGAPKIKTMQIIKELEKEPRGVYTGAIGYISPNRDACFNVAIRTISLNQDKAELGIGGGIVYDSLKESEYCEALLKASFLTRKFPPFKLIESILWTPSKGYYLLELHLARLKRSGEYFSIPLDINKVEKSLKELATNFKGEKVKVRVLVGRNGEILIEEERLADICQPVKVKLNTQKIDSYNCFLYHKTTNRLIYDCQRQKALEEGFFDVIFLNTREELSEGAITNIFLSKQGILYTPKLSCGLLPGVLREHLLSEGKVRECTLYLKDLKEADKVYIGNSVRGLLEVEVIFSQDLKENALLKVGPSDIIKT
ncbi:MAG: aminodeoxychorismate synthase component I [Candidatus Omnitrophota bacterium]|nr:MAG: aminodeoxychorismate synthase component I [Candidatus Omnitrophota bacterium]